MIMQNDSETINNHIESKKKKKQYHHNLINISIGFDLARGKEN